MRRLSITFVNRNCAHVSGYGSRDLLTKMRGRPPVWSTLSRAWVTTPETARDLIAVAESRDYEVYVTEDDQEAGQAERRHADQGDHHRGVPAAGGGLW